MHPHDPLRQVLQNNTMAAAQELVRNEDDSGVQCLACGNRCHIPEGESGICRMRFNRLGELRVPSGYVAGLQADPIEKKPFFHVFPGQEALSFGMLGCNLHCEFCQNWVSSQALRDDHAGGHIQPVSADELVQMAARRKTPVMVSTYNEPLITSDWAVEVFKRARPQGIVCGYVSNGHATPEVLAFLRPHMDLFKVDLKTFSPENYRRLGCDVQNVLDSIQRINDLGFWLEIVTLVVPGFNNSPEEIRQIAHFIAGVSPDIPWHVTAFHPDYRMTHAHRTTASDLDKAWQIGKEAGLRFVYAGNLPGRTGDRENTFCPECQALLIRRTGFSVEENRIRGGACPDCSAPIPGVWG